MYDWKSCAIALSLVLGTALLPAGSERPVSSVVAAGLSEEKVTDLGLYLSSQDAHAFLEQNPETLFIDTRDPLEISVMGHPTGIDAIVPIYVHSNVYDESIGQFSLTPNPDFIEAWDRTLSDRNLTKTDLIIVTCGNGRRSAKAVNALAAAGYTNVWHIIDGYEGEADENRNGRNTKNAWRIEGLHWSLTNTLPGAAFARIID